MKGTQEKEIEDKENPQDCLGGRDGTISNMVSPEVFLEERVSKLRPSGESRNSLGIQGLGDRAGVGHLGVGVCPCKLIPQLPRLGRAHPAVCTAVTTHRVWLSWQPLNTQGLTREIRVTKG